jgi:hypothetical protein
VLVPVYFKSLVARLVEDAVPFGQCIPTPPHHPTTHKRVIVVVISRTTTTEGDTSGSGAALEQQGGAEGPEGEVVSAPNPVRPKSLRPIWEEEVRLAALEHASHRLGDAHATATGRGAT